MHHKDRAVTIEARPESIQVDIGKCAVLVIDMQNDFGAKGGMFDRAGIDISPIEQAVAPTMRALAAARSAAIPIVYLKMQHTADLANAGRPNAPHWIKHRPLAVGETTASPDGRPSRVLVEDTWNTEILPSLAPRGRLTASPVRFQPQCPFVNVTQSSGDPRRPPQSARGRVAHPHARDDEIGRDLGQRREDESAVEEFRMGQRQLFAPERNVVIGDEVDVDDARSPPLGGYAAEVDLERLHALEQRLGSQAGQAEGAGVDEPVLIGLAPRGGAVEAGDAR